MKKIPFLLCLLFLPSLLTAEETESAFSWLSEVRYQLGDHPSWSSPDFDDSPWETAYFWDLPGAHEIIWIRGELEITSNQRRPGEPLGLGIGLLATCEIYWDGELLPRRGTVGATAEEEVPGPIEFLLQIPDRLAQPGLHKLALRCSTHHRHFEPQSGFWVVSAGPYESLALFGRGASWKAMASLSGMLIFGIFSLVLFALEPKDRSHLLLGLFCLAGAGLLVAESWRSLFPYTYNWHLLRLSVVTALAWVLGLLLIAFLNTRFRLPQGKVALLVTSGFATLPVFLLKSWDAKVLAILFIFGVVGFVLAGQAVMRRERGSGLVAIGLFLGLALGFSNPTRFADQSLYPALDLLLVCLLISHAFQLRRTREEREEARLKSARLEIELLRRHIQPHFLMNTLTALSEWMEEDPKVAGKMIQALAEEFRLLSEISSRKLIRMAEELRLCRYHLEIMSHRRDCVFRLTATGVDETAPIPPAVLHTLVENALTHNRYTQAEVEFHLRQEAEETATRWIFEAPTEAASLPQESAEETAAEETAAEETAAEETAAEETAAEGTAAEETAAEGTGLRYIRARLREGFGEQSTFHQSLSNGFWRSEIVVPSESQEIGK